MTVSLVGYTNAGKSTLLNALTGADVLAENKLFATLDTRTRRWQLPGWGPVLLSDTVGFIRDLPHHLIASFKATLEESRQADLLLHVADASNPAVLSSRSPPCTACWKNWASRPRTRCWCSTRSTRSPIAGNSTACSALSATPIPISARRGTGSGPAGRPVSQALSHGFLDVDVETEADNGRLLAFLAAHGEVLSQQYHDSRVTVHCRIPQQHLGPIRDSATQHSSACDDGNGHVERIDAAPPRHDRRRRLDRCGRQ